MLTCDNDCCSSYCCASVATSFMRHSKLSNLMVRSCNVCSKYWIFILESFIDWFANFCCSSKTNSNPTYIAPTVSRATKSKSHLPASMTANSSHLRDSEPVVKLLGAAGRSPGYREPSPKTLIEASVTDRLLPFPYLFIHCYNRYKSHGLLWSNNN